MQWVGSIIEKNDRNQILTLPSESDASVHARQLILPSQVHLYRRSSLINSTWNCVIWMAVLGQYLFDT